MKSALKPIRLLPEMRGALNNWEKDPLVVAVEKATKRKANNLFCYPNLAQNPTNPKLWKKNAGLAPPPP